MNFVVVCLRWKSNTLKAELKKAKANPKEAAKIFCPSRRKAANIDRASSTDSLRPTGLLLRR